MTLTREERRLNARYMGDAFRKYQNEELQMTTYAHPTGQLLFFRDPDGLLQIDMSHVQFNELKWLLGTDADVEPPEWAIDSGQVR